MREFESHTPNGAGAFGGAGVKTESVGFGHEKPAEREESKEKQKKGGTHSSEVERLPCKQLAVGSIPTASWGLGVGVRCGAGPVAGA